jgi:magnesium chelatase family protein
MLATVRSAALLGIEAFHVTVEVNVSGGLPEYRVVGLPAAPVREGAVRIRSALNQIQLDMPQKKVTVNLAPADRVKGGAAFDLPIAIGVLAGESHVGLDRLDGLLVSGELGLDGELRPIRGALAVALTARRLRLRGVVLPALSAAEAAVIDDLEVYEAEHLKDVLAFLRGEAQLARAVPRAQVSTRALEFGPDMTDVRGQEKARAALEIAVAGGHNLLMFGPPGIGKTMLARRVPTILPPFTRDEALETTQIYSAVGLTRGGLVAERPFRAPHHSISQAALLGGGSQPRPGEISLAHNGVLFLDEMPEFSRAALEGLRQPLEDREVTVGRVHSTITIPASFLLVGSANPCPCGWFGSQVRECKCSTLHSDRYQKRLSGPLLDRIDLRIFVDSVSYEELRGAVPAEPSSAIRDRVVEARARQLQRLARYGCRINAELSPRALRETCRLDSAAERVLSRLHQVRTGMSARASTRLVKVARTIADLAGKDIIDRDCLLEAATYRPPEKNEPPRESRGGPETSRCVVS